MKFAIVNNQKVEAQKGLKGVCCLCQQPVIPKCGIYRTNHWAHKSITHCDKWWENETDWHRQWKNKFPIEWQEVIANDEKTGEKHIADIKTNGGMVVEFQHSNISNEERISRELFYKHMIWVVDGTRRKRDFFHFTKAFDYDAIWPITIDNSLHVLYNVQRHLPKEWIQSRMPVLFDFKGTLDKNEYYDNDPLREPLWCLLPITITYQDSIIRPVIKCDRKILEEEILKGGFVFDDRKIKNAVEEQLKTEYYLNCYRYFWEL